MEATIEITLTEQDKVMMRFSQKVLLPDDLYNTEVCWLWQGARHSKKRGYGKFRMKINGESKVVNAHKASYLIYVGEVEEGQVIAHQCNNEFCVSPHHLEAQTQSENMQYCVASGRHSNGK